MRRTQQRLDFLRRLRKCGMSPQILSSSSSSVPEPVLTACTTGWSRSSTVEEPKHLQREVKTASRTRTPQASLQSIHHQRVNRRAASIITPPVLTSTLRPKVRNCEM